MSSVSRKQAGFTIIELTLATAVFSVILLVITAGIISFTKNYLKGIHQSQTQETARLVSSEIAQAIQFSKGFTGPVTSNGWTAYCFGNVMYSYRTGVRFDASDPNNTHVLLRSPYDGSNCVPSGYLAGRDTELIGNNMRLAPKPLISGSNPYTVAVRVVYGEEDLNAGDTCSGGEGDQFCAAAELSTTVQQRL